MGSAVHHLLAIGAAGLALGASAAQAQNSIAGSVPGSMPLGQASAPPPGFLALCERAPQECLSTDRVSPEGLSQVRAWAGQTRWTATFQAAGLLIAPTAPAAVADDRQTTSAVGASPFIRVANAGAAPLAAGSLPSKTKLTPSERRARKDAGRKIDRRKPGYFVASGSPGAPPPVHALPLSTRPLFAAPPVRPPSPPPAIAAVPTRALQTLNNRINRAIRRASDADAYGREDLWMLPTGVRPSGDCEDYVLAKRRALIETGVDPAALSIAIVRTRRGETHAVLLVATPEGEQVLDNLSPWVLRWDQAPYDWLERQSPGQALTWVMAAA